MTSFKDFLGELKLHYPLMEAAETQLHQVAGGHDYLISQLADHLVASGGKRLRPALTILASSLYPLSDEAIVDMAVAGELIHLASLIHDDIIDGADLRRGERTLNATWGNRISVLTGDYLFATAFEILTELNATSVLGQMTKAIKIMCQGQVEEVASAYRFEQSEAQYYECIRKKTAQLLATCCQSGALLANGPQEQVDGLGDYGLQLGYAFQIIDDILDLTAKETELGKPVRADFAQGTLTLPVIYVLQHWAHADELIRLVQSGQGHKPRAQRLLDEALASEDAIPYAWQAVGARINQALKALQVLPAKPARFFLETLAQKLLATAPDYVTQVPMLRV